MVALPIGEVRGTVGAPRRRLVGRFSSGHLVMIVDPVEETFPFSGQAVLHEPEAGIELRVGDAGSWGQAYRDRIRLHRDAIEDLARRRGWTLTIHRTDRPTTEAALRLVTLVTAARGGYANVMTNLAG